MVHTFFFFFFTLVTGPRRSLSLQLSDTKVYEPQLVHTPNTSLGMAAVGRSRHTQDSHSAHTRQSLGTHKTVTRHTQDSHSAHTRQSLGTHKTVTRHTQDSHSAHTSQSLGTHKTVRNRFWSWFSGEIPRNLLRCSLFARQRTLHTTSLGRARANSTYTPHLRPTPHTPNPDL